MGPIKNCFSQGHAFQSCSNPQMLVNKDTGEKDIGGLRSPVGKKVEGVQSNGVLRMRKSIVIIIIPLTPVTSALLGRQSADEDSDRGSFRRGPYH